jgi:VCBS repeat protein
MIKGTWRLDEQFPTRPFRGALLAACLLLTALVTSGQVSAREIAQAHFIGPTKSYTHGILGDAIEYSGMMIRLSDGSSFLVGHSEGGRVFEDIVPRLWDITGDGTPEIVVIETDPPQGAQLAIYGLRDGSVTKLAATPHIGRTHRWLAPIGAADLDGDGYVEVAYIDRPHLAKTLRVWRYVEGELIEVASAKGLTNHRIGEDFITGGIRDCAGMPELITADANWSRIIASTLRNGAIATRDIGPFDGPDSIKAALACQ